MAPSPEKSNNNEPEESSSKAPDSQKGPESSKLEDGAPGTGSASGTAKPMELAGGKVEFGVFKKLYYKIGEKVGTVKTTEFSEEYISAVTEMDAYVTTLTQINKGAISLLQQNEAYHKTSDLRPDFDAPKGEDPYERLCATLEMYASNSVNKKQLNKLAESSKRVANAHRQLQVLGRKHFHHIRTFLKIDVENMRVERENVLRSREVMDYARHELESSPGVFKQHKFDRAKKDYDKQCARVIASVKGLKDTRTQHRVEILHFLEDMKVFNQTAAIEFEKFAAILPQLAQSPATNSPND